MAKAAGARIFFGDEAGVRSDYHAGTTWGVKGKTPVVPRTGQRKSINMLSAVTARGDLRFMLVRGRVNGVVFAEFLRRLMHNAAHPVFLILDGHSIHHSRPVRDFVASQEGRLRLFFLPPYSPELNPDEQVWNYVKHHGIGKAVLRAATDLRRSWLVMDLNKGMCETALEYMPGPEEVARCKWLTDAEVDVYAGEYGRTGFQGALNCYRRNADASLNSPLQIYSGKTIDVPSCFLAGKSDWGVYQTFGALDAMTNRVCRKLDGPHFIDGAGHWVQEEQPEPVASIIRKFLRKHN